MPEDRSSYHRVGEDLFAPSLQVQGAWREDEQHMAPVAGLITHCLQNHRPRPDLQLSQLSFDILGVIGLTETRVEVQTLRAGRTIELLGAELSVGGRVAVRATGWRLARADTTALVGGPDSSASMPAPADCPLWPEMRHWPGGFIRSIEIRRAPDLPEAPGSVRCWLRSRVALLDDEPVSSLATFTALSDTANGIGTRLDPRHWTFPNLDLSLHLHRTPELGTDPADSGWAGIEAAMTSGPDGVGRTSSRLHDRHGPVGRAEQILTIRPR